MKLTPIELFEKHKINPQSAANMAVGVLMGNQVKIEFEIEVPEDLFPEWESVKFTLEPVERKKCFSKTTPAPRSS